MARSSLIGKQYLTRTIKIKSNLEDRRLPTRGHVEITGEETGGGRTRYLVKWLMKDGSERKDSRLPKTLARHQLLIEVKTDGGS